MEKEELLRRMEEAVKAYDDEEARRLAEEAVGMGLDPVEALEEGLAKGLREVGDRFGRGEAFITELIAAAQAMEAGAEILNREIERRGAAREALGRFLIGTVEGDIHSIGKNIVATMLKAAGFEVVDIGVDVPTEAFVEKVRELKPDILGLSALMTTTMVKQKEVVEALKTAGLRDQVKIIIGGAPVTPDWAREIEADAVGLDAASAVEAALRLIGAKR
ncbi:MAG: Trimethylamine methyltransferase corrinoid protein [Candidatus Bathyarchaeota archaeon B23]|nr:MAG: Trimethylamine methyltransferase corrinoid protein [Candidatus Bathyarchaeota archaeon B23]